MDNKTYYRLNYDISPWLPQGSIWYRVSEGHWEREDASHSVGAAKDCDPYWFAIMLEQESTEPSGGLIAERILTKVKRSEPWVEEDQA